MSVSWFAHGKHPGARTVEQQMQCLEPLLPRVTGKTILDCGAAEGLIGLELLKAGASLVHGVDNQPDRIAMARKLFKNTSARFWCSDVQSLAELDLEPAYDIVLLLAILHKLKQPEDLLQDAMKRARELIAIRLPDPVIKDRRSGFRKIDVGAILAAEFRLVHDCRGYNHEWTALFERRL